MINGIDDIDDIDQLLLDLHDAANTNDVSAIKKILKTHPSLLDEQDVNGFTALHVAICGGHIQVVKALIRAGADLNIRDFMEQPPIAYANDFLKKLLLEHGAMEFDPTFDEIHQVVSDGQVKKIKALLKSNPEKRDLQDKNGYTPLMLAVQGGKLNIVKVLIENGANIHLTDNYGWSALFHAANLQNKAIVDFLLEKGANPDELEFGQINLVDIAKLDGVETPLSTYLKKRIGLPREVLENLSVQFKALVEREFEVAKQQGKKLLVMFGEAHYVFKILQVEECFLKAAHELGIDTILVEQNENHAIEYPSDLYAKDTLGMRVKQIDNYPRDENAEDTYIDQRNAVMAKQIHKFNNHAIVRIGAAHLYGLLEKPESKINTEQFHVVPFNLANIALFSGKLGCVEANFAISPNRVIQVLQDGITYPKTALQHWNRTIDNPNLYTPLKSLKRRKHKQPEEQGPKNASKRQKIK